MGAGVKGEQAAGGGGAEEWPVFTRLRESAAQFCSTFLEVRLYAPGPVKAQPPVIMETIICRVTYFTSQRNVYLKFLRALLKGL